MINPTESDIGQKVVYTPFTGCRPEDREEGVITSFNDLCVFVRYGAEYTSKCTNREDLEYVCSTRK